MCFIFSRLLKQTEKNDDESSAWWQCSQTKWNHKKKKKTNIFTNCIHQCTTYTYSYNSQIRAKRLKIAQSDSLAIATKFYGNIYVCAILVKDEHKKLFFFLFFFWFNSIQFVSLSYSILSHTRSSISHLACDAEHCMTVWILLLFDLYVCT